MRKPLLYIGLLGVMVAGVAEAAADDEPRVLSFAGLRAMEESKRVSPEEMVKEWQAFVKRSEAQIAYAKKSIHRWKSAKDAKLIDLAIETERSESISLADKVEAWKVVSTVFQGKPVEARAGERIAYWSRLETRRRVQLATEIEAKRPSKPERIKGWVHVLAWTNQGPEAKAAARRIDALQRRLYQEAELADRIEGLGNDTRVDAWSKVMAGKPSRAQRRVALRRLKELGGA